MFRTVSLSIIRSLVLYTQQYIQVMLSDSAVALADSQHNLYILLAVYTVLDSWWWTENLSETCTVLFQK